MCMSLSIVEMLQTGFRQGELDDGERILLIYVIWFALLEKVQCLGICGCSYTGRFNVSERGWRVYICLPTVKTSPELNPLESDRDPTTLFSKVGVYVLYRDRRRLRFP